MSFEQLRYKKYASDEIIALLTSETVWFSRRISFADSAVNRADRISVSALQSADKAVDLTITATIFNTMDSITPLLLADGFAEQAVDGGKALQRVWSSSIARSQEPVALLAHIVKAVDEVAGCLPLLLYSSRIRKIIVDYLAVMKSAHALLSIQKLSADIGECPELAQQRDQVFLVTQIAKTEWIAWLPGDDFAPAFPSQDAVIAFAKVRQWLLAPGSDFNSRIYEPTARNVYKLVDNKKSLWERIRWLRRESARLERLLPLYDPLLEQAK